MVVFPGFELLDLAGPLDVFARAPDVKALTIAESMKPVVPDLAPAIAPDATFDDAPPFDVLFVPGGHGIGASFENEKLIDFVAARARSARYVTSVCTGALVLGVAGLLDGRKATTHWRYLDLLKLFGATPVSKRVVEDGNIMTGAGVTAGMDFGFALVARLRGADVAKRLQLGLEYDPDPPFRAGHPSVADKADVETYVRDTTPRYDERERLIRDAVRRRARSSPSP